MRQLEAHPGNMTAALQDALNQGPGELRLGPGIYTCNGVMIPDGVTLSGEGAATILRLDGGSTLLNQVDRHQWAVCNLVLEGPAGEDWKDRTDQGQVGLQIDRCWGFSVCGVTVRRFDGVGLQIKHTPLSSGKAPYCNGGNLDRLTLHGCWVGLRFDERAEYLNAVAISAFENVTGVVIHGGNIKMVASNICSNIDGIYLEDKENGSHGALGNCLINHNQRHAIWCRNVRNGMSIQNSCVFYGDILLENSQGVVISGGELCCNLLVREGGINRISGNYIIPYAGICERFECAPGTILEGNFTTQGPWSAPS